MKRLSLLVVVLCFAFVSCEEKKASEKTNMQPVEVEKECHKHHKDKACEMTEEQKKECDEFKKKWDNWANLSDIEKKELVNKKKACIDKKKAEMEECEAKMKEKKAEFDAQFAKWDKLTVDEQKALLDKMGECCKEKKCDGHKDKGCCKKEK